MAAPVRLAHLVSHPIQYFAPLYARVAADPRVHLRVFFASDASVRGYDDPGFGARIQWDTPLLDGYDHVIADSARRRDIAEGARLRPNADVIRALGRFRPDAVWLHGYTHANAWLGAALARARGAKVLIRVEQNLDNPAPGWRRAAKRLALRPLFAHAEGLAIGSRNRAYLEHYGMRPERIHLAPYCVDNARLQAAADELAPRRDAVRRGLGIDDDAPVVLFSGKLVDKKQPLRLLDAFARVRAERPCWLLVAGDGPLRAQVEARARAVPNVILAGVLNQSELPRAYAAADVFALPSSFHETWGLVVNEAMNFGLPVVVSDRVGSGPDLVTPGWNGAIHPAEDTGALARELGALVADPERRRAYGARSRERIADFDVSRTACAIVEAATA